MPFLNYTHKNNATAGMVGAISASATSLICTATKGALFPSAFPFLLTLEAWSGTTVTKREIVRCTNRVADTFTIVRSAGSCPASDSAVTQTTTAFSFDPTSETVTIKHKATAEDFDDINAELVRIVGTDIPLLLPKAGGAMTGPILQAQSANVASATTTDLSTMTGDSGTITGTTTITGFGTVQAGTIKYLTFSGILTLTHNGTSLILPTGANITTAVGDTMIVRSLGSGNWRCLAYTKADGTALVSSAPSSATTVAEGIARLSTDAEARAGTNTSTIITPAQLAMMKENYQIKFPVENATYIRTYIGSDQLQATPDYIYTAYPTTATNTRIHRYDRQSNGSYVFRGTIANITVASGDCCGITVIGSYVYVGQFDGGAGGIRVYRLALDLTGSTLMTGTMTMTNPTSRTCMTGDGTDLFFTDYSGGFAVNAVKRWTISGTTLSSGSTISLSVAGSTGGHFLYKYPSGGIYIIDVDANVSSIAYWNNAGTAQTAITTYLSTYTANIERAMGFFKYAGTSCFARMRKNDATNSSDILIQAIDLI